MSTPTPIRRVSAVLAFLTLAALPAFAQDDEAIPKTFSESTTVLVVEVPVIVHKDRLPVRGLTAENFEIRENGQRREIVGFEVVDLALYGGKAEGEAAPGSVPVGGRRHFLLLFDLSFTRPHSIAKAVAAARELLPDLHASDLVGIGVFGLSGGARPVLGFTADRRQLERTLDVIDRLLDGKLTAEEMEGEGPDDPLKLQASPAAVAAEVGRAAGIELSGAGEVLFDGVEDNLGNGAGLLSEVLYEVEEHSRKAMLERRRDDVEQLADNLSALAEETRDLEGRKYLVFFSEGFEDAVLHGDYWKGRSLRASASNNSYTASGGASQVIEKMGDRFRRAGWIIQVVDPGGARDRDYLFDNSGLTNDGFRNSYDSSNGLAMFAYETGGEFYRSFNNLGLAMEGMLAKTSVTYLLSFQTGEIPLDGDYHEIKVALKNAPRGADASYKPGYYAPEPWKTVDEEATSFAIAQLILSDDDGGDLDVAALTTEFKADDGKTGLAVWLEADGDALLAGHKGEKVEADVFVYALDDSGKIHDFFTKRIEIDPVTAEATLTQGKLKVYGDVVLEPGHYRLRTLVRDAKSHRYGVGTVPVEVDALTAAEVKLLEPILFDDPTRLYAAFRETDFTEEKDDPFSFGADAFFPAVRPTLSTERDARFCLMAYHLFLEGMQMRAAVVRSDGTPVEQKRLAVAGRSETSFDGLDRFFFDFHPQGLEKGEYTFMVAIGDPGSGNAYRASKSFSVVN